ncbi:MAG: hypothetical protein QOE28_2523 [Solirubrobacteraceae bacterium]|nr:hypothetical protein [Solirubrobacteraceae bacterium]
MGRNRVTLQTIADALGVSRTTVSNAYNRPDQLAAELRDRILATAAELGYSGPDAAARRLRSGGAEALGLLFTGSLAYAVSDPASVVFLRGFAQAAEEAGVALLVVPSRRGLAREAVVEGFCIYTMPEGDPDVQAALDRGLPVVVVDEPRIEGRPFIGVDNRAGTREAAAHLTALGHRRFGVISFRTRDDDYSGPLTSEREAAGNYPLAHDRLAGWRDALAEAGIDWAAVPKQERSENSVASGADAARALLAEDPAITAVVCASDQLALGVLHAAAKLGRSVPGELSVVGFDDAPPAAQATPPLTTVRQPLLEKGLTAGRMVLAGATAAEDVLLPVELVVRGSTGQPRR